MAADRVGRAVPEGSICAIVGLLAIKTLAIQIGISELTYAWALSLG
jgi:hypothetical protein